MDDFKITISYSAKNNDLRIICDFKDYLLEMDKNSLDDLINFLKNVQRKL